MTAVTAGTLLILFLPFLLSLAGKAGTPMVLCLATSIFALLRSPHQSCCARGTFKGLRLYRISGVFRGKRSASAEAAKHPLYD